MTGWEGKKVLVTGGEGFIGSHLVEALARAGAEVRALVHYNPMGHRGWLEGTEVAVEVVPGDVRDQERVYKAVERCDFVFHLAALIGIPYSYEAPESYLQTNVQGSFNVAMACVRAGSRMVHTSTSEVYGTALKVPIDESHPLQPQSPYSASKIGGDMMVLSLHNAYGLPVSVVRPFNTYGPRQSTRAVIPTILAQLHSGSKTVSLGATSPTRDFNFVADTVSGFMAVAQCERAIGEVVNVGSGREISIKDLVSTLIDVSGKDAGISVDPKRLRPETSEVERLLCDNSRAREWAGWTPQVSLEDGLRMTSEWVEMHLSDLMTKGYHV